jgi:O-acetylhomoserine (thiol)-lyase
MLVQEQVIPPPIPERSYLSDHFLCLHDSAHAAARFGLADAGNIYGRLTNSTRRYWKSASAALEGGVAALAVASGAVAISYTIEALAQKGEHIVAQKNHLRRQLQSAGTHTASVRHETTFVDAHNSCRGGRAIGPNTKAVYLETLGNPTSTFRTLTPLRTSPTNTACRW